MLQTNILSSIQEGMIVYDRNLKCLHWNQTMETITGLEQKEVIGKHLLEVVPQFVEHGIDTMIKGSIDGQSMSSEEIRFQHSKNKTKGYIWGRFFPMRNTESEIIGGVAVVTDISERKLFEYEIHESEKILRNVIDTMDDILLITDLRGKVLQVNRAFLHVLGYSRSEVLGQEFPYSWLFEDEMGRFVTWITNLRQQNWLHDFDMTWKAKDGRYIPMSLSTTLLRNSMGEAVAILNIARDITERVRLAKDLENRIKELDDFTYVVSHDLKEPLISVEGFSKILQSDYQDTIGSEGKEFLDLIAGATTRMKGLIDDLLLLSRVGRPIETFKPVSIKKVVDEVKAEMEFTIRQRSVCLNVPEYLPRVFGNKTHLKIVFRNLIGNAIKFNDKSTPIIEIGFQSAENNYYLFFVKDNGIGIDKEFHEKIFIIFQRLHPREQYEGTGAGLAIVKKIIETHKGTIWVESHVGEGSIFFFTLPRETPHG